MIEILIVLYLVVGLAIYAHMSRYVQSSGPPLDGIVNITLLWLPLVLIAIGLTIRSEY